MNDEIREAAERLREMRRLSAECDGGYPPTKEGRRQSILDHAILADAYLAEHPADDAEPVTPERLRELGWEDETGDMDGWWITSPESTACDVRLSYFPEWPHRMKIENCVAEGVWLDQIKTMGNVRRLCAELGIKLEES